MSSEVVQPTIFALSSGHGRAGVAVIRISGPAAGAVLDTMAAPRPKPRFAALRRVVMPGADELIDYGLALWFPGPRSETGEDMAELQVHGGRAVIQAVLAGLGRIEGCRLAEPGEFARRAFENGKLDLTSVEGLADLIDAETSAQRRQALRQAEGALSRLYLGWRQRLLATTALMEAAIDFSDEADVAADSVRKARAEAEALHAEIGRHLDDGHRGEVIREGFRIVLAGPPNVGKSSLLNALAKRDVAIVSEEAGTTRDVVEVKLDIEGMPLVISDTAGIRESAGKVEQEGIRRALGRAREADLVLWMVDASNLDAPAHPEIEVRADKMLVVVNKFDLLDSQVLQPLPEGAIAVSALTGLGLDRLTLRLAGYARGRIGTDSAELPALTQARHRQQLERCRAALASFLGSPIEEFELRAEDLRRASLALGRITGSVHPEEVLGEIFGRFCIGK
ncbi:MAG TPA: tRNA uridine-5-carboxymethylaminomethyl(34) synthesis GTPase MnmE [Hyphomicrobiaceae bacterium]|nr:tRNA uridine-5-carboxymethylaminomethyl(34) synthesis GTPase MnmE [Hyphomicrobiaceae bacterium]